jgi:hypothetical protein
MKVYFVVDYNEITNSALFRNKKDAQRYIKNDTGYDSNLVLDVIEFKPNKNGIMDAMRDVLSSSGNSINDWERE